MASNGIIGRIAIIGLALLIAPTGFAQQDTRGSGMTLNPIFSGGLAGGGDTVATYVIGEGNESYELELDAGGTLYAFGGISMRWPDRHVGVTVQGGYFSDSVSNSGWRELGHFTRWPVELIGLVEFDRLRFGLGVTQHLSPHFEDKTGTGPSIRFPDASGSVFQFEYLFPQFSAHLRYVGIDYAVGDAQRIDGDHIGIGMTWRFGRRWNDI